MPATVIKASNESRSNNTLAADSELVIPLTTGVYRIRGLIRWNSPATPDFKLGARVNGGTLIWSAGAITTSTLSSAVTSRISWLGQTNLQSLVARPVEGGTSAAYTFATLDVMLQVEGDCVFEFLWAQNTTSGSEPATVWAGSLLWYDQPTALPYFEWRYREIDNIQLVNAAPTDDDTLFIELEPNTGYVVESCLLIPYSGTWGRQCNVKFVYDGGDIAVASFIQEKSQTDSSPTSFSNSTTTRDVIAGSEVDESVGGITFNGGGGATSGGRAMSHVRGQLFTGELGGTLKVQVGRSGTNEGGSARLLAGSWISTEKLPPC